MRGPTQCPRRRDQVCPAGPAPLSPAPGPAWQCPPRSIVAAVDFEAARNWYQKAADANQIDAMTNLGRLYEAGEGVPQDFGRAFALYQAAAAGGSAIAMANLANLYEFGNGVDPSPKDAAFWRARAIMAGNMDALGSLVEAPEEYSPDVLAQLQIFLTARGLYSGPVDGAMSEPMAAALRKLPGEQP